MGRQFKVLLIGAAFTVVAMGFAYAVPRAMHSAAGGSSRDSILLLTGSEESPGPSGSPADVCDEPVASEEPSSSEPEEPVASEEPPASEQPPVSEEPVASEQPASEAPVASEEPCDDGDGGVDPADENDGEGSGGSATNHGSAVRVVAHCDVHGRAHGELVRSIAHDKDATVASAEQACADALSAEVQGDPKDKAKSKKDKKPKKYHDRESVPGRSKSDGGSGGSKAPKAPKPAKLKPSSGGAGSSNSGTGHSAGAGKSKVKNK